MEQHPLAALCVGFIMFVGYIRQAIIIAHDSEFKRIYIPGVFAAIAIVGTIAWEIFELSFQAVEAEEAMMYIGIAFLFGIALVLKTFFSSMWVAILISSVIYMYVTRGVFHLPEFIDIFLDFLFQAFPKWVKSIYFWVTATYSFALTVAEETITDAIDEIF